MASFANRVTGSAAKLLRGSVAFVLFALFGAGSAVLSPLMPVLRTPDRCQPPIRFAWRILVALCRATGLISVDASGLRRVRGCVLAASHPSLIDVVIVVALVPRTLFVAKHSLARNPVLRAIVRHAALPDDPRLLETAPEYLAAGWNVLVFPEGTRTRVRGSLNPLRRGTAQLVLRSGAPLSCVKIETSARILGKGQNPFDMTAKTVRYTLRSRDVRFVPDPSEPLRSRAVRLSRAMAEALSAP